MNKLILYGAALCLTANGASKRRDWQIGTVADSAMTSRTYVAGTTSTAATNGRMSPDYGAGSGIHGSTTTDTTVQHVTIDTNELIIVGDEYVYTVQDSTRKGGGLVNRAVANHKHGCRFIVGDGIQYAQEKRSLYVQDEDGKECKLAITRQERRAR